MNKPGKKRVRDPRYASLSVRTGAKVDLMAAHELYVRQYGKTTFFDFMDMRAAEIRGAYETNRN